MVVRTERVTYVPEHRKVLLLQLFRILFCLIIKFFTSHAFFLYHFDTYVASNDRDYLSKKIFFGAIIISSHLVLKALHFDKTIEFLKFIGDLKGFHLLVVGTFGHLT